MFTENSEILDYVNEVIATPYAEPQRTDLYEGEDIWIRCSITGKHEQDLSPILSRDGKLLTLLRIFRGDEELTDALSITGSDVMPNNTYMHFYLTPEEMDSFRVNQYYHLEPGRYWGILDAGAMSERFRFTVQSLPDSLQMMRELHSKADGFPRQERMRMLGPRPQEIEAYANYLLKLPKSTPLRMEGLRNCAIKLQHFR
jgi:hypothetical protein